jgi:succinoglycan biosynthesis protein ExoM
VRWRTLGERERVGHPDGQRKGTRDVTAASTTPCAGGPATGPSGGRSLDRATVCEPLLVAVTACTKLRPNGLTALLESLAHQEATSVPSRVAVVIADNDPAGSGRAIVEAWAQHHELEIRYVLEAAPGIPAARNAAVEGALAWAREVAPERGSAALDLVLFVDDDERPEPNWIRSLLDVYLDTGASVVTATVVPHFPVPAPSWVLEGRFFEREHYPTGTELNFARTSNTLVDARLFTDDGLRFESVGMQGGSDSYFFARAHARGHRIVWADDAVVHEDVPLSRMTPRWLVARHYRYGLGRSAILRKQRVGRLRYARRLAYGVAVTVAGVSRLAVARRRAARVLAAQRAATGAGLVLGLFGARYDDYRFVHGS